MPLYKHLFSNITLLQYALLLLISFSNADGQQPLQPSAEAAPKRVAVIGAGSAGSSTAYYLRKHVETSDTPLNITVFERASYIGGRSTTVDVFDNPAYPIELGASIFVQANYNLMNASRDLGLTTQGASSAQPRETDDIIGIWDGSEFVYKWQDTYSWWNIGKILWRYGLSPIRTQNLMKSTVKSFLRLYEEPMFPFPSLSSAAAALGLVNGTATPGQEFLAKNGVSDDFSREIIQASTRVNYGQNLPLIHGLESMVCMAAEGAVSVQGGNWRIFDEMLKSSTADVRLNTTVTSIVRNDRDGTLTLKSSHPDANSNKQENVFDEVVIAGPLQYSGLSISPPLDHTLDEIPYVTLYVTLFSSPHRLSSKFFGLKGDERAPETILTTLPKGLDLGPSKEGVGPASFWSISTLRTVKPPTTSVTDDENKHYVYKVFSPERPTAEFISQILNLDTNTDNTGSIAELPKEDISWFHEKTWNPYPVLFPRVTFDEPHVGPNIWYTGGIESFISTMETSSLMGRNVAALMFGSWKEEKGSVEVPKGWEGEKKDDL